MSILSKTLIAFIAIEHIYILWIEMFAWETAGRKTFRGAMPDALFAPTKKLAANQGLYNGFLAAGLIWSLLISEGYWSKNVACFFLSCVAIAGIYGGVTAAKKIIYVQALPAIIAIIIICFS